MRRLLVLALVLLGTLFVGVASAFAEPPPNDDFADAQAIEGVLPMEAAGTTVGATREAGEPTDTGEYTPGYTVWFRWVAPVTEYVSIDTCDPDMAVSVYTGDEVGALTEVRTQGPEDFYNAVNHFCRAEHSGYVSSVRFKAQAGTAYKIQVDGHAFPEEQSWVGQEAFVLKIAQWAPPANDDFADAEPLFAGDRDHPISTFNASHERGEPYPRGVPGGGSIWFHWTAPQSGFAEFEVCTSTVDRTEVAVYTGSRLRELTPVPEIEHAHNPCYYVFPVVGGETYRLQVDSPYDASAGEAAPLEGIAELFYQYEGENDFADPIPLASVDEWSLEDLPRYEEEKFDLDNYYATKQPGEPDHAGNAGGASVWLSYHVRKSGHMEFSTCESTFRTLLAVYTGSHIESLTPVASSLAGGGRSCREPFGQGDVQFNVEAGETLDIAVDGYDGARGKFNLKIAWSADVLPDPPAPAPPAAVVAPAPPTPKIAARHIDQRRRSATFALHSTQPGTHFRCRLDKGRFAACGSKVTYRHLRTGHHLFKALSVGATGKHGAPVTARFSIHR